MFAIGNIAWPSDARAAYCLYLQFLLNVLEALHVDLGVSQINAIAVTKSYLAGSASRADIVAVAEKYWDFLDEGDRLKDFSSAETVKARLALCLLVPDENDIGALGDNLSWFFEVLGFAGIKLDSVFRMMESYFSAYLLKR